MTVAFFFLSVARAAESRDARHILHLAITCEDQPASRTQAVVGRALRRHNPGADVRLVEMSWPCAGDDVQKKAAVDELVSRLDGLLETVDVFDLIALDFPDLGSDQPTLVAPFGHVSPNGIDDEVREALGPLENRAKADAKILMLAGKFLTEPSEWSEGRVSHLLDFFGASRGRLFGLETEKHFVEPFSLKKDVRLGATVLALSATFTFALWAQPAYTCKAIGLSFLYGTGFSILHRALTGETEAHLKFDENNPPTPETLRAWIDDTTFLQAVNFVAPSVLGNLVTAAQFLGTAGIGSVFYKSLAIQAAIWVPMYLVSVPVIRRGKFLLGQALGTINSGRIFARTPDGDFVVTPASFYDHSARIFGCESELVDVTTPVDAPENRTAA